MIPIRHVWLLFACATLPLRSGAADPTDARKQRQTDSQPSLAGLQRARLIRCKLYESSRGTHREVSFTGAQLERVKDWIQRYAWPPIDLNTIGNVMPRAVFSVFERADGKKPNFTIQIFGSTTRAQPSRIHVSNDDWKKFISLIPPR